jgi:hypothetical protein
MRSSIAIRDLIEMDSVVNVRAPLSSKIITGTKMAERPGTRLPEYKGLMSCALVGTPRVGKVSRARRQQQHHLPLHTPV